MIEEREQIDEEVREFYFHVRNFLNIYEELDENYVIYTELEENGAFKLKLFCVNPAVNLQNFLSQGNSTIFFSATLLPIRYYKKLLSVETDDYAIYAHSPFAEENRLLVLGQDVSTKYTRRGADMYERFGIYIKNVMQAKPGNYLAFFPSYQFWKRCEMHLTDIEQKKCAVWCRSRIWMSRSEKRFYRHLRRTGKEV